MFLSTAILLQPIINLALVTWGFELSLFNGWFIYKPWRLFLVITSIFPLFSLLVILRLPESPKLLLAQGRNDECLYILQQIYICNNGGKKEVTCIY